MQEQLKQRYLQLRLDRNGGRIDQQTFENEVAQLRFQTDDGSWWQIDAESGEWLFWNGQDWTPPTASQKMALIAAAGKEKNTPKKESQPVTQPKQSEAKPSGNLAARHEAARRNAEAETVNSAAELKGCISIDFKGLAIQILKNTFSRYRVMLIIGIIAFLLHTFLIAVGNDGFNKNINISNMFFKLSSYSSTLFGPGLPWYIDWTIGDFRVGSNIAIIGNEYNAALGWFFGGAMVLGAWRGFLNHGLFGGLGRLIAMPRQIAGACSPHMGLNLAAIFVGALLARWLSDMMPHQAQNMSSFISLGLVGSIIPLALGTYISRIGMHFASALKLPFLRNVSYAALTQLIFLGVSAGMFSKSCWQYGPTAGWAIALYTAYLVITRPNQPAIVTPRLASFLTFAAIAGALVAISEEMALAHDKGWWENVNPNDPITKQITSWVKAGGSKELMQAGVPPSVGAAIGAGVVDAATTTTTYVLQVSSYSLSVSPEEPEELMVAVWKSENCGPLVPAGDASISITASSSNWLILGSTSGSCRLTCRVSQSTSSAGGSEMLQPVSLYVTGIGGGQSCSATVTVMPGGGPAYVLEIF